MKFGTDGIRGIIDEDFTEDTVEIVTRAICHMLARDGRHGTLTIDFSGHEITQPFKRRLIVGWDRRRKSDEYARVAADVAKGEGFDVLLADGAASTPALSYAVKAKEADGAIVITASHNPPQFNGLKFKPFYAGSSIEEITGPIEAELDALQEDISAKPAWMGTGTISKFSPAPDYIDALRTAVDIDAIADSGLHPVFDPIHGAASGMLPAVFEDTSLRIDEIRSEPDFNFGGVNPEPLAETLGPLVDAVRQAGDGAIGLATDGDGDRLGVIDHAGDFHSSQVIFPLLMRHLVEHRGKRSGVARTFSVSELIDAIGRKHNITIYEEPIGFKYLATHLVKGEAFLGGEESGGIGFDLLIPERCGVLAALILLEACSERGKNVKEMIGEMFEEYGPHYTGRIDLPLSRKVTRGQVKDLVENHGRHALAGFKPKAIFTFDGTKVYFSPRGFILFRPSGTEPLLRIYAESDDLSSTAELLNIGRKLVVEKTDFLVSDG
jgi:phosphomannomutase